MKPLFACYLWTATLMLAGPAAAAPDAAQLAKDKVCLGCHMVDRKVVGPAYRDVAARYKGQPDAAAKLAAKILHGGSGVWGTAVMPPNRVTPAEATQLAEWVLSRQ